MAELVPAILAEDMQAIWAMRALAAAAAAA